MKVVVTIKQVPDTNEVKLDSRTGTLIREGVPSIINPEDKNALEEALKVKETAGAEVIVITMGPPQADDALREALAMGADDAILVSDRAFAGADTWATATTLGKVIQKIGGYDLILAGRQAIDGDTAQVGPQLAEYLGIPQITYATDINVGEGTVTAKRGLEDGYEVIQAKLPALLTVTKEANKPRYPTAPGIISAYRSRRVKVWTSKELDAEPGTLGLEGSPTQVKRSFSPPAKEPGETVTLPPDEAAKEILSRLKTRNIIQS